MVEPRILKASILTGIIRYVRYAHGFNQTVDQTAQRTVVNQHVDISIGKYNQEQDIRRADIPLWSARENIKEARPDPFA